MGRQFNTKAYESDSLRKNGLNLFLKMGSNVKMEFFVSFCSFFTLFVSR